MFWVKSLFFATFTMLCQLRLDNSLVGLSRRVAKTSQPDSTAYTNSSKHEPRLIGSFHSRNLLRPSSKCSSPNLICYSSCEPKPASRFRRSEAPKTLIHLAPGFLGLRSCVPSLPESSGAENSRSSSKAPHRAPLRL